jgi:hypothetical protein
MDAFVFFLVVGLIILIGVLVSVRLYVPGTLGTGRFRRIRRLRTFRAAPGAAGYVPTGTVIEEIIDEDEPVEEEEEEV